MSRFPHHQAPTTAPVSGDPSGYGALPAEAPAGPAHAGAGEGSLVGLDPEHPLAGLDHLDGLGLAVLLVFAALGLWRGLWWQAMRLVGLAAAVLAAKTFGPRLSEWAAGPWPDLDGRLSLGGAWLIVFLAALALALWVGRLGRQLLRAMQLGPLDRFGGLVAGAITGLLLHAALVAVLVQLGPAEWAQRTVHGSRSERLMVALGQQVPLLFDSGTAERVRALLAAPPGQAAQAFHRAGGWPPGGQDPHGPGFGPPPPPEHGWTPDGDPWGPGPPAEEIESQGGPPAPAPLPPAPESNPGSGAEPRPGPRVR